MESKEVIRITMKPDYTFFDSVFNSAIAGLSSKYGTDYGNFSGVVEEKNIVAVANRIALKSCTLYKEDIRRTF